MNDLTLFPPTSATGPDALTVAQTVPVPSPIVAAPPEPDPSDIRSEIPGAETITAEDASQPTGVDNVIEATAACKQAEPELAIPETGPKPPLVFTEAQLSDAGVVFQVTDVTKFVEINGAAQAALIAAAPGYAPNEIIAAVLGAFGIEGQVQMNTHPATATLSLWQSASPKDGAAAPSGEPSNSASGIDGLIAERGKIYGDPELSHENIGLNWTGMLQQHYQLRLDHPLPAWLVELMMAGFKIHRSAITFHADNYDDLEAYGLKFARQHQRAAFAGKAGV